MPMLASLKRLTKHSAVYGIGHIVSRSLGFLLLPIHTNYLEPHSYGLAALLFSALAILNVFFTYGLDTAFLRFFALAEKKEQKCRLFSSAFWTIFTTGILFSAILLIYPRPVSLWIFRSPDHLVLIRLAAAILFFDALVLLPFLILRAEEKSRQFVLLKTAGIAVNLGMNIILVGLLKLGVAGIFWSNFIASAVTFLMMMPIILSWLRWTFDRSDWSELMKFGLPYVPSVLSVIVMDQISRFFIARLIGAEATGIFSASYKLGMFMGLLCAAFRFAWHPFFLSTAKQPDAQRIFARVLTYFLWVTSIFFLLISFFVDEIVRIRIFGFQIFGEQFAGGLSIVPIVMLAYILYGVYVNFFIGIFLKKKSHYVPVITGMGGLTALLGNYFLIPLCGLIGAAWATTLAYGVMAAALYGISRKLYPVPYEWTRVLKLTLIVTLLFGIGYLLWPSGPFWFHILLILSLFPGLWVMRFFTPEEHRQIRRLIKIGKNG